MFGWLAFVLQNLSGSLDTNLRKAVAAALLADSGVSAIAGTRIRPLYVPGENLPALVYQIVSETRRSRLDGPNTIHDARVQFKCISKSLDDARALAEAIRRRFDGFTGFLGGTSLTVLECFHDGSRDLADEPDDGSNEPFLSTTVDYVFRYRIPRPTRPTP